jgi:hypothetical protein
MKHGGKSMAKKGSAGMAGRDSFKESRTKKEGLKKPSGYGGTKNSTYIRPQPK